MKAQYYHNIQFAYDVSEAIKFSVGIDNLLQNDPPYVYGWTDANTDTMTYDLLGRRGYMRLTYRMQ
jgi:outer membrane receptor for ferrienterochelin and colicin